VLAEVNIKILNDLVNYLSVMVTLPVATYGSLAKY
jgi:hypothetical protein